MTSIETMDPAQEYRAAMQLAALCFLQRHDAEHLGDDQLLFTRTVNHLHFALEVPMYLAETLAGLAHGELRSNGDKRRLDLTTSSESVAVLSDPAAGKTYTVPVALIFRSLIDIPERPRHPAVP